MKLQFGNKSSIGQIKERKSAQSGDGGWESKIKLLAQHRAKG